MNPTARGGPFWTPITPQTGSFFHAESHLYSKAIKVSDEEMLALNIIRNEFHGEWNYTIRLTNNRSEALIIRRPLVDVASYSEGAAGEWERNGVSQRWLGC